jgi:hypothetical protein
MRAIHTCAALVLAVLITCFAAGHAQEKLEGSAPPTGLALETDTKAGPVGYQSVPGSSFGGIYRRLDTGKVEAGLPPPAPTFKKTFAMEGDAVRIKVFALTDRFREKETLIGDFLLREGERIVVEGMKAYGYEPMELAIVSVKRLPHPPPVATSRVPSVGVERVEPVESNFPSFRVTLRNLSVKDITYLEVKTHRDGRDGTIYWPRGEQNRPLVKAGETYDVRAWGGGSGQKSPDGIAPSAPHTVEIVTAVFADKSFEGDAKSAAKFIAGLLGQKTQITRALALLADAPESDAVASRVALDSLESRVSALKREAVPAMFEEFAAESSVIKEAGHEAVRFFVEGGLDQVRKELLKDVREYKQALERGPADKPYEAWLTGLKQKYEAWLSRL